MQNFRMESAAYSLLFFLLVSFYLSFHFVLLFSVVKSGGYISGVASLGHFERVGVQIGFELFAFL